MIWVFIIIGTLLIILFFVLRFWVGKRKFNRRNIAGVEGFSSYGKAVTTTIFENIMLFVALLCFLTGLFILCMCWLYHTGTIKNEMDDLGRYIFR
jgi:hypothetical protein